MPTGQIRVTTPTGRENASKVKVKPGETVQLTADAPETGAVWQRNNNSNLPPAAQTPDPATLVFTMDKQGDASGAYRYGASNVITIERREVLLRRIWNHGLGVVAGVMIYVAIIALFMINRLWSNAPGVLTFRAYFLATTTMIFIGGVLWVAGWSSSDGRGLAYLVQGTDRRGSTSKVQYLLWTFGVAFALAYILFRVGLNPKVEGFECSKELGRTANCVSPDTWDQYLILLGVPAATAVVAKAVNSYKVVQGTLQKTTADGASLADVATNDNGQADIADIQYLIFNVVAFVYVAVNFVGRGVLVDVPAMLLGLTSAAAGTYALNKALQNNRPVITSVEPSVISPGTAVTIRGRNLFPAGARDEVPVTVTIGGITTTGVKADETVKVAKAPGGMSSTDAAVSVTTAANVTTDKYPVTIVGELNIVGLVGPPTRQDPFEIQVEGLPDKTGDVWVTLGSMTVSAPFDAKGVVTVTPPPSLSAGNVEMKIGYQGRWSDPRTVNFS